MKYNLYKMARKGELGRIRELVEGERITVDDIASKDYKAIKQALVFGHEELAGYLTSQCPGYNIYIDKDYAFALGARGQISLEALYKYSSPYCIGGEFINPYVFVGMIHQKQYIKLTKYAKILLSYDNTDIFVVAAIKSKSLSILHYLIMDLKMNPKIPSYQYKKNLFNFAKKVFGEYTVNMLGLTLEEE